MIVNKYLIDFLSSYSGNTQYEIVKASCLNRAKVKINVKGTRGEDKLAYFVVIGYSYIYCD